MTCTVSEVKKIMNEILLEDDVNYEALDKDQNLQEIDFNSVKTIMLIVSLEEYYGFEWEDDELLLENLDTLQKIVESVNRQLSKNCF